MSPVVDGDEGGGGDDEGDGGEDGDEDDGGLVVAGGPAVGLCSVVLGTVPVCAELAVVAGAAGVGTLVTAVLVVVRSDEVPGDGALTPISAVPVMRLAHPASTIASATSSTPADLRIESLLVGPRMDHEEGGRSRCS